MYILVCHLATSASRNGCGTVARAEITRAHLEESSVEACAPGGAHGHPMVLRRSSAQCSHYWLIRPRDQPYHRISCGDNISHGRNPSDKSAAEGTRTPSKPKFDRHSWGTRPARAVPAPSGHQPKDFHGCIRWPDLCVQSSTSTSPEPPANQACRETRSATLQGQ